MQKTMEVMFNNNAIVELRTSWAGWQQVMKLLKKERKEERLAEMSMCITSLERALQESTFAQGKQRRGQMQRTMELLFNNSAVVCTRLGFSGWLQVVGQEKVQRKQEAKMLLLMRVDNIENFLEHQTFIAPGAKDRSRTPQR